jgi:SulP family sulfate permease
VRANEPAVVYRLSRRRLSMLQEKLPPLATSLDRFLVNLLARRVAHADLMVRDLMR